MDLREVRAGQTRRHPWERARASALRRIIEGVSFGRVLEVGCGDGFAGAELLADRPVEYTGVDPNLDAGRIAVLETRHPGWTYTRELEPRDGRSVDLLLLLDVLEHVEDDRALLLRVVDEHLAPGGHALITAPAFQVLFSAHDRFLHHIRRYSPDDLQAAAEAAGLSRLRRGYLFSSLLPVRALSVALQRAMPAWRPAKLGLGAWSHGNLVTRALELALEADNRLLFALAAAGVRLPGLTIWMLCRRP